MVTLVTVDIWDTLLRRKCHPDEVKLATARRMALRFSTSLPDSYTARQLFELRVQSERSIGKARAARGFDDEYAIEDVLERVLTSALTDGAVESYGIAKIAEFAHNFADAEVIHEISVCSLDPAGADIVRSAANTPGGRVVAISDFYMGETRLRKILGAVAPDVSEKIERVFVSCDIFLNKRSGRLFEYVRTEMRASASSHTHVGDNRWSDVKMAEKSGATAEHFRYEPLDTLRLEHEKRFALRTGGDISPTVSRMADALADVRSVPDGLTPTQQRLYAIGREHAPIFAGLVVSACERAASVGAPSVHYFTREGELFAKIHERLHLAGAMNFSMPEPVVLEVSRLATFFPSLRTITTQELMRLWNQYSKQSMGQLLRTLGVSVFAATPFLTQHGLALDEILPRPWKDPRVVALFEDRVFVRFLEAQRDEQRALLLAYFSTKGLTPTTHNAVIVDIGWRGTIQDNIAHMLPNTQISGVYLGLQRMLNIQPENVHKEAFGPDARRDQPALVELLRCVAPYEMVCNAPTGSVTGYAPDHNTDTVVATRQDDEGENSVHRRYIDALQRGVLDAMGEIGSAMRTFVLTSHDIRPMCVRLLGNLAHTPDPELARAFFSLVHNETFGVGGFVDKRFTMPSGLVARARSTTEGWNEMLAFLETTSWPSGFLRLHGLDDLHERYLGRLDQHVSVRSVWPYRAVVLARSTRIGRMIPSRIIPKTLIKKALGIPDASAHHAAIEMKSRVTHTDTPARANPSTEHQKV